MTKFYNNKKNPQTFSKNCIILLTKNFPSSKKEDNEEKKRIANNNNKITNGINKNIEKTMIDQVDVSKELLKFLK